MDAVRRCSRPGFGAIFVAVDPLTNEVYAVNQQDNSVTTINGNRCDGSNSGGCATPRTRAIVGDEPSVITIDPFLDTGYVTDDEGVSVVPLNR